MALLLALIFLVVPFAELAVIVAVANTLGVLDTIALLIVVSIVGAWLAKREGFGVLARIRAALDRGELPSREVADGFLILFAGALMITPGFLTDCLALVLLFPPTRVPIRRVLVRWVARRGHIAVVSRAGRGSPGPGGDVWDADSWEGPPRRPDELGGPRL